MIFSYRQITLSYVVKIKYTVMVYDEIDWNDRTGRRHSSNTRSDRIRFRERFHTRCRWIRVVHSRGTVPGVRRDIP
jgi:hypothetical protein